MPGRDERPLPPAAPRTPRQNPPTPIPLAGSPAPHSGVRKHLRRGRSFGGRGLACTGGDDGRYTPSPRPLLRCRPRRRQKAAVATRPPRPYPASIRLHATYLVHYHDRGRRGSVFLFFIETIKVISLPPRLPRRSHAIRSSTAPALFASLSRPSIRLPGSCATIVPPKNLTDTASPQKRPLAYFWGRFRKHATFH